MSSNDGEETPLEDGTHYRYSDENHCELSARTSPCDDTLIVAISFPTVYDYEWSKDGGDVQLSWTEVVKLYTALGKWIGKTRRWCQCEVRHLKRSEDLVMKDGYWVCKHCGGHILGN